MDINSSTEVIYDLLKSATLLARQRFQDGINDLNSEYMSLETRISLLKKYGTVRLGVGRQSGATTAAIRLSNEFFSGKTLYLGPRFDEYRREGATNTAHWTDTSSQNPTGIKAVFADPGPHAGMQAQRAIYTLAAEAMMTRDGVTPVFIYFVGC